MRRCFLHCCILLVLLSVTLVSTPASAHVYPENRIKAPKLDIQVYTGEHVYLSQELHWAQCFYTYEFTVSVVEIKLSCFGARYLEHTRPPRFTSPDPTLSANFDLTNPQSFNLYTYAINNPIKYIDPTGEFYQPPKEFWEGKPYSRYLPEWTPNFIRSAVEFLEPTPEDQITFGGAFLPFAGAITSSTGTASKNIITKAIKKIFGKAPKNSVTRSLSKSEQRAIRSLEKQISKHEKKLADFKKNPTVRPGMENLPKEVIEKQQQTRILHLETEIQTFKDNINKILIGKE